MQGQRSLPQTRPQSSHSVVMVRWPSVDLVMAWGGGENFIGVGLGVEGRGAFEHHADLGADVL